MVIFRKTGEQHDREDNSDGARRIEELIAVIDGLPDIRSDKIRSVRHSVRSGAYHIDPRKIAERILEEGF